MTIRIRMIIATLMLMVSMGMDAQIKVGNQTDSAKIAEYRERKHYDMNLSPVMLSLSGYLKTKKELLSTLEKSIEGSLPSKIKIVAGI